MECVAKMRTGIDFGVHISGRIKKRILLTILSLTHLHSLLESASVAELHHHGVMLALWVSEWNGIVWGGMRCGVG